MGRAWVLHVPPTPAGPGPGPPFLCGVSPGPQGCSGQGAEVGLLPRVGFLGVSLFSKHLSVLFAVCGTLGEMRWRGDRAPRGPCCPPCPRAASRAAARGRRRWGRAWRDLPSAAAHGAPALGASACRQAGALTPTSSCPPCCPRLCPPGSADRGPVCVCVCVPVAELCPSGGF